MPAVCKVISPLLHVLRVSGKSLDSGAIGSLRALCNQSRSAGASAVIVDLGAPDLCDHAGLAELIELFRASSIQMSLSFCNAGPTVAAALAAVGLDRLLPFRATVQDVLAEPSYRKLQLVGLRAVVLCAGTGSRMQPMTHLVPKPMLDVAGRPVLEHILRHLESFGLSDIVLNLGHLGPQIPAHFKAVGRGAQNLFFLPEGHFAPDGWAAEPLGSMSTLARLGGRHFAFHDDTFVLCGDALVDIDLARMLDCHRKSDAAVTIAVQEIDASEVDRYGIVATDSSGRIVDFQEKPHRSEALSRQANTGIYLFRPDALAALPDEPGLDIAKDLFPRLIRAGMRLQTYAEPFQWTDIGCGRDYYRAVAQVLSGQLPQVAPSGSRTGDMIWTSPGAIVSPRAEIIGPCHIGAGAVIEAGAKIIGPCAIGAGSVVEGSSLVRESLVWSGTRVTTGTWVDQMIAAPDWAMTHHYADGKPRPCLPLDGLISVTLPPAVEPPAESMLAS